MKREQLHQYLEQQVQVTLFDGSSYVGIFMRCDDKRFETNPNLFLKPNYYVLINNQETIIHSQHSTRPVRTIYPCR